MHTTGIGLVAAPGEGRWIHDKTETIVKVIKRTMRRIRHEHPILPPSILLYNYYIDLKPFGRQCGNGSLQTLSHVSFSIGLEARS